MNKYKIEYTTRLKKSYKKMIKQGYNQEDFLKVIGMLSKIVRNLLYSNYFWYISKSLHLEYLKPL